MNGVLEANLLGSLSCWIAEHAGLHYPEERWVDLQRGVTAAARDLHFSSAESYARHLLASPGTRSQIQAIASHLTVGETYFFRDKPVLAALQNHVFPELIQAGRETGRDLRIWSAGCCTGEEPYSLAILLRQSIPDYRHWKIRILATDINSHFLQRARQGVYRDWSFRETDPETQRRFFVCPQKDHFEILPDIKSMVTFDYLNLADNNYPSPLTGIHALNMILCRNVLMYFSPEQAKETVHRLFRSLAPGGWLIVSPSEASQSLMADFAPVNFPGAILYRKADKDALRAWQPKDWQAAVEPMPVSAPVEALPYIPDLPPEPPPDTQPVSLEERAFDLYVLGDYASASEILTAALAVNPDDAQSMILMARIRANQGALAEALEWGSKATSVDKLNPSGHYLLGTILLECGQCVEAAAALRRALYLDQGFVLAHFALGNLRQRQGRSKESVRHFENALHALRTCPADVPLPESEGITPGRLAEFIQSAIQPITLNTR